MIKTNNKKKVKLKDTVLFVTCYVAFAISLVLFLFFLYAYVATKKEIAIVAMCIALFVLTISGFISHNIVSKTRYDDLESKSQKNQSERE